MVQKMSHIRISSIGLTTTALVSLYSARAVWPNLLSKIPWYKKMPHIRICCIEVSIIALIFLWSTRAVWPNLVNQIPWCWGKWYEGWRRFIGCLEVQVIFRKRATNYRALLWKMTYEDKASYDSTPPCMAQSVESNSMVLGQMVRR